MDFAAEASKRRVQAFLSTRLSVSARPGRRRASVSACSERDLTMLVRRSPRQGFALFAAGLALALSAIPVLATGDPTATPGNGPAAIAITVRTCAAGYDPAKDGADPKTD